MALEQNILKTEINAMNEIGKMIYRMENEHYLIVIEK
jgi:hypothetical protein